MNINNFPSVSEYLRAVVEQEEADARKLEEACQLAPRRPRRINGPSVVFSMRLSREEFEALERRASAQKIKPSVLARAYVRAGVARRTDSVVVEAVDRLEAAVVELRAAVGGVVAAPG